MRAIAFKTPVSHKGKIDIEARNGYPIKLQVGAREVKFILQFDREGAEPKKLVHFASGQIVGDLNEQAIRMMCGAWGTSYALSKREIAKALIDRLVSHLGADAINAKMDAAPKIN